MHATSIIVGQLGITRRLLVEIADGLDDERLITIPPGFNNHILWNLGHVTVTLRLLCYRLSGLDTGFAPTVIDDFGKGSSPRAWTGTYAYQEFRELLCNQHELLAADLADGVFRHFQPYRTSAGVELTSIDDAIAFNHFHEGIHLGAVMALRRAVA